MSDALSSNRPSQGLEARISLCNSHARRNFVDVISHFPDEVDYVVERYSKVWTNEHKVIELALTPAKRRLYHVKHSLPIMEEIKKWGETHLAEETVEANSGLGKAISYFINHYVGLICFLHYYGG